MITDQLAQAVSAGPLANPEFLVAVHVSSHQLGARSGPGRPEAQLHRALAQFDPDQPPRIRVNGPAGSGKTSLILRGASEAAVGDTALSALILRCGEDPEKLASEAAFTGHMINTIRTQGTFATVDLERLAQTVASTQTTGSAKTHSAAIGGGAVPLNYRFDWTEPINSFVSEPNPAEQRQLLIDQLTAAAAETRMVVVIDDTDRFVTSHADGTPDNESITNLFRHGVSFLAELPVALVVAVHPHYDTVPAVQEICSRAGFASVEVARLPADQQLVPLERILDKRLKHAGHDQSPASLFDREALAQLQAIYFEGARHNLRAMLRLSGRSAAIAAEADAARVTVQHVQAALQENEGR